MEPLRFVKKIRLAQEYVYHYFDHTEHSTLIQMFCEYCERRRCASYHGAPW